MKVALPELEAVAGELHAEGRGALGEGAVPDVAHGGAGEAPCIDAVVGKEAHVLPRLESFDEEGRDVLAGKQAALGAMKGGDLPVLKVKDDRPLRHGRDFPQVEAQGEAEYQAFKDMIDALTGRGGESLVSDLLQRHVVSRLSDEGLIVEVFDVPGTPLFEGANKISPELWAILGAVADVFRLAVNDIAIEGHVMSSDSDDFVPSPWTISTARADAVRHLANL